MKSKVGIIDYGIGNWSSIRNILFYLGFKPVISSNHDELRVCDSLLLPGVGAFRPAMESIIFKELDVFIYEMSSKKKPLLGICLGMQLLGRSSPEMGYTKGLNIIPDDVCQLDDDSYHIGWNSIKLTTNDELIKKLDNNDFYFNHSFAFNWDSKYSIGYTEYNSMKFSSIIKKDNIYGLQFHPEKSQVNGLKLLKNLLININHTHHA